MWCRPCRPPSRPWLASKTCRLFSVDVDTAGFRRACDDLFAGLVQTASEAAMAGSKAAELEAKAILRSTTKRHTGQLEDLTISSRVSLTSARFKSSAKYARFIDSGTRPHVIAARNGEFLRFVKNGSVYFRRFVHHPGTAPRPFIDRAIATGELAMNLIAERGVERAAAVFNRA